MEHDVGSRNGGGADHEKPARIGGFSIQTDEGTRLTPGWGDLISGAGGAGPIKKDDEIIVERKRSGRVATGGFVRVEFDKFADVRSGRITL